MGKAIQKMDLVLILVTVLFFAVSLAYAVGCERL
jgi:hypothetical protein